MESESFLSQVKPQNTVHRIIWMAFVGAVPVYAIAAYFQIDQDGSGGGPSLPHIFAVTMVVLSVLTGALALFMPRILLPDWRLRQLLNKPLSPPTTAGISDDERRLLALLPDFFVCFMVRLAFSEAIALYGLVLAFLSKSLVAILPFAVVSIALLLMVPLPMDSMRQRIASLGPQAGGMPTQPR